MSSSLAPLSASEGSGSVSGAPNLHAGFTDTFTSRYIDTGELRLHAVIGGEGPPLLVHGWRSRPRPSPMAASGTCSASWASARATRSTARCPMSRWVAATFVVAGKVRLALVLSTTNARIQASDS